MNLNPEIVDEYFRQAGEIEYPSNHDRKLTAWVNHQGLDAAFVVGRAQNESHGDLKFDDTMGILSAGVPLIIAVITKTDLSPQKK